MRVRERAETNGGRGEVFWIVYRDMAERGTAHAAQRHRKQHAGIRKSFRSVQLVKRMNKDSSSIMTSFFS